MEPAVTQRDLQLRERELVEIDRLNATRYGDQLAQLRYHPRNGLLWDVVGSRAVVSILECSHCYAVSNSRIYI